MVLSTSASVFASVSDCAFSSALTLAFQYCSDAASGSEYCTSSSAFATSSEEALEALEASEEASEEALEEASEASSDAIEGFEGAEEASEEASEKAPEEASEEVSEVSEVSSDAIEGFEASEEASEEASVVSEVSRPLIISKSSEALHALVVDCNAPSKMLRIAAKTSIKVSLAETPLVSKLLMISANLATMTPIDKSPA